MVLALKTDIKATEQNREPRYKFVPIESTRVLRICKREKIVSSTTVSGKTGYSHAKELN